MSHHLKKQAGFTLIELLIVISIIGILSTIATVSLGASQQRARDAQRKSDLKQVQNALEIYYNNNSIYPTPNGGGGISLATGGTNGWGGTWTGYMRTVPNDPLGTPTYCYSQPSGTSSYNLYTKIENTNDTDPNKGGPYTCSAVTNYNYLLQNPY